MSFIESFQHENVFERFFAKLNFFCIDFYINLTLEVNLQAIKKQFNLNNLYENTAKKVIAFATDVTLWLIVTKHSQRSCIRWH